MQLIAKAGQKIAYSVLQRRMVLYNSCQVVQATEAVDYPLNMLKEAYNAELYREGVDAYVDIVKEIRGTFQSELITDLWVASESPIPATVAALILFIIGAITSTVAFVVILSAAGTFVERIWPTSKFYSPDGKVFNSLSEYITYMQNIWNPAKGYPFTCPYCGRGFVTEEELNEHVEQCAYKEGWPEPPKPGTDITRIIMYGLIGLGIILIVPKVIEAIPRSR